MTVLHISMTDFAQEHNNFSQEEWVALSQQGWGEVPRPVDGGGAPSASFRFRNKHQYRVKFVPMKISFRSLVYVRANQYSFHGKFTIFMYTYINL